MVTLFIITFTQASIAAGEQDPTIIGQIMTGLYKGVFSGIAQSTATPILEAASFIKKQAMRGIYSFNEKPVEDQYNEFNINQLKRNLTVSKLKKTEILIEKYDHKLKRCKNPEKRNLFLQDLKDNLLINKSLKQEINDLDRQFTKSTLRAMKNTNNQRTIGIFVKSIFFPFIVLPRIFFTSNQPLDKQKVEAESQKYMNKPSIPGLKKSSPEELNDFLQSLDGDDNDNLIVQDIEQNGK